MTSMRDTIDWVEVMYSFCCFHSMHISMCVFVTQNSFFVAFLHLLRVFPLIVPFFPRMLDTGEASKSTGKHLRKVTSCLVHTQSSRAATTNDEFHRNFSLIKEKKKNTEVKHQSSTKSRLFAWQVHDGGEEKPRSGIIQKRELPTTDFKRKEGINLPDWSSARCGRTVMVVRLPVCAISAKKRGVKHADPAFSADLSQNATFLSCVWERSPEPERKEKRRPV
jgi:hypothetical protein